MYNNQCIIRSNNNITIILEIIICTYVHVSYVQDYIANSTSTI